MKPFCIAQVFEINYARTERLNRLVDEKKSHRPELHNRRKGSQGTAVGRRGRLREKRVSCILNILVIRLMLVRRAVSAINRLGVSCPSRLEIVP